MENGRGRRDHSFIAACRRRDLLLTLVMLGIALTPAWLAPGWLAVPWGVAILVLAFPAVVLTWTHAPWVPTPVAELPRILRALDLAPGERFCDLGAGDGRMVLRVRAATGAICTGIEALPLLYLVARLRLALQGDDGATVRLGDLHRADLSDVDVVYVWGTAYATGTAGFREHLQASLRPGARIVTYHTPLQGLAPVAVDEDGPRPIYSYVR